jgi:hypothetical protein
MKEITFHHQAILAVTFCMLLGSGCSDFPTGINTNFDEGFFQVRGYKIEQDLLWPQGGLISSDTTWIEFTIEIRKEKEKNDTIRVYGLEGLNGREVCLCHPEYPVVCNYATYSDTELEFDNLTPGGHYSGTGTLDNGRITLQTTYFRRSVRIEYDLHGIYVGRDKILRGICR